MTFLPSRRTGVVLILIAANLLLAHRATAVTPTGRFICAARNDGMVYFYDIDNAHALVKTIRAFSETGVNIRGIAAAKPTHRLYISYNSNSEGHVVCIDLNTDSVLWNKVLHSPGVDRGDVTPDGRTLYMPTSEGDMNSPYELVVDAVTGNLISHIPMPTQSHDTFCTLDGTKAYMEVKSNDYYVRVVSTQTDSVTSRVGPFNDVVMPFAVKRDNSLMIANVVGVYGFQYANPATGQVLGTAHFTGTTFQDDPLLLRAHGIGMTPDESEAWVCDRGTGNHYVHVFDLTSLPPTQTHLVTVGSDNPRWLTFSIDGRFCYVREGKGAANTDIIDTATYRRIGSIGIAEEVVLEVDFANGAVSAVGSQYGAGRGGGPSPSPTPTPRPSPTPTPTPSPTPSPTPTPTATPSATPTPTPSATPTPSPTEDEVTSFTLINADTDQPVSGFSVINNGAVIDTALLPTSHLNIRANTRPAVVGSVRFGFDGQPNMQMQNVAPYALFDDKAGDYNAGTLSQGKHSITATPYTGTSGTGTAGTSMAASFTVMSSTTPSPTPTPAPDETVVSFTLINADTDQPVRGYEVINNGAVIDSTKLPTSHLNIRANTNPAIVGSVRFGYDGNANARMQNFSPYALFSDSRGDFYAGTLAVGRHTVTATPFTGASETGTAGASLSISFAVTTSN